MGGRAAAGEHDGDHPAGVERGGLRRRQVGGDEHGPRGHVGDQAAVGRAAPGQVGLDLAPDRPDVVRASPLVGVGQGGQRTGHRLDGLAPGGAGALPGGDAGAGAIEQVGVVEQQQVRVEHRRLGLAGDRGRVVAAAPDVLLGVGQRGVQQRLLRGWVTHGVVVRRRFRHRRKLPGPADRDAGRRRQRTGSRWWVRMGGRRRAGPRGCRSEVAEPVPGQVEQALDGPFGVGTAGRHVDDVALLRAERSHPREAARGHGLAAAGAVAEADVGLEPPHRPDQDGRGPGVQPVRPRHLEPPRHLERSRRLEPPCRVGVGVGEGVRRVAHVDADGRVRGSGDHQVRLLGAERAPRLGGHPVPVGTAGRGHGGHAQPLDERSRAQRDALPQGRVEQVERDLGGEHGAAEIHEDDDAGAGVGSGDRVGDADGVGAEAPVVEPRGLLETDVVPVQHHARERDRGAGQGPAVGDDDETDGTDGTSWIHRRGTRGAHGASAGSACAAAAISSAAEVAPGSWWPTLRSPR